MFRTHAETDARRHRKRWLLAAGTIGLEVLPLWRRGYGLGGRVIVRCRDGHLFSTIWVPAASVKALRLGPWRVQRCPVGHHWSVVTPVPRADLQHDELDRARETRDTPIP